MKWRNLKKNLCPKCGKDIVWIDNSKVFFCHDSKCSFKINETRFKEITMEMAQAGLSVGSLTRRLTAEFENQEGMNKL